MQNSGRPFRNLAREKILEAAAPVGVHHRLLIYPTDPFQRPHVERVLSQQFPGLVALGMPLFEAQIQLIDEGDLLDRHIYPFLQMFRFQHQLPLALRAQFVLVSV